MDKLNFSQALTHLKMGAKLQREGWNGKHMWIQVQRPDEHSKMDLPYVYMFTADAELVPWLCSQTDMFAEDWQEVE